MRRLLLMIQVHDPINHWTNRGYFSNLRSMTKIAAPKSPVPPRESKMPFEEALQKLEAVVEAMESDDVPLEKLLSQYEEGCRLVQICQAKLAEAELKIQQLEQDASGNLALKPVSLPEASPLE